MTPDAQLFLFLNRDLGWDGFAPFMKAVSDFRLFLPLVLLAAIWMTWRDGLRGRIVVLTLLVAVPLTDQVSSHVLKPLIGRPRPCRPESGLVGVKTHGAYCSGRGAFPSSHAANTAAAGVILGSWYRRAGLPAALVILVVGWSRIYLGVHYPGDVAGGWALGALLGGAATWGAHRVRDRLRRRRGETVRDP